MKDYEIILWLKRLEPETDKQAKAIQAAERAFYNATEINIDSDIEEFLSAYKREDIINKPSGELYEEYLEYCTDCDLMEVSHTELTKVVMYTYNVIVKVSKVNGKSVEF